MSTRKPYYPKTPNQRFANAAPPHTPEQECDAAYGDYLRELLAREIERRDHREAERARKDRLVGKLEELGRAEAEIEELEARIEAVALNAKARDLSGRLRAGLDAVFDALPSQFEAVLDRSLEGARAAEDNLYLGGEAKGLWSEDEARRLVEGLEACRETLQKGLLVRPKAELCEKLASEKEKCEKLFNEHVNLQEKAVELNKATTTTVLKITSDKLTNYLDI